MHTFPRKLTRVGAAAALGLFVSIVPLAATAGAALPCSYPEVFPGAAVNALVLPYRYVGSKETPELALASRQIAALVHLQILFSMLKYGSVGATDLIADTKVCDVDEVIGRVSRSGGSGTLALGQTLVVVWGRLFDQGNELYVQSYVRFFQQGDKQPMPEDLSVTVMVKTVTTPLKLHGSLPTQALAFPAWQISKSDFERVDQEFRRSMVVRKEKSLDSPGVSIAFDPHRGFPYSVRKSEGDWMWIQPTMGGPAGWVRARIGDTAGSEAWSLERWLPELAFVDGVNGFMRLRARNGSGLDAKFRSEVSKSTENAFQRFENLVPLGNAPEAYGLARAIRGFISWQTDPAPTGRLDATRLFKDARANMPDYAAASNLAAIGEAAGDGALDASGLAKLHRELLGAVALDPHNSVVLANLEAVYQMMASYPGLGPLPQKELSERLSVVHAAQAKSQ